MARTLVGRLQLIVQAMGLGEAKKVEGAMSSIERAAKRLSGAAWGQNFQRQLEKMALGARELDHVRRSWDSLQNDMSRRGLTAALRKSEISAWKTSTVGHFAAVRASAKLAHDQMDRTLRLMRPLGRSVMVAGGAYTGAYGFGLAGREALKAASDARRVQAEAKYAGLSADERGRIDARANDLSGRYRLSKSQIYEVMKEASLSMPSTDAALSVSDEMARAFLVFSNMFGSDGAIGGLRQFNKAMDNIEKVTPDEYRGMLENYAKAQQVVGKDMEPEAFAQAIKYSRTGGKVFSSEFLSQWLPMLIAETGGSDAGTQLRAVFDQFIVGRASKQSLAAQRRFGVRGEDGKLIGQDAFGENPLTWIYDVLLPKLAEHGVDKENEVELARVIGQLTNNRLSSDLVTRAILSFEQYRRLVEERLPNAAGLKAADDIQKDNPFAALDGFKASLKNLSDAVLPMERIGAGLNTFADHINAFTRKIREGDPKVLGTAAAAGGALALWGSAKVVAGIWGLVTAGPALHSAAAALTAAAVAQGGPGVLGKAGKVAGGGLLGWLARAGLGAVGSPAGLAAGAGIITGKALLATTPRDPSMVNPGRQAETDNYHRLFHGVQFEGGMHRVGRGAGPAPGGGMFDEMLAGMDKVNSTTVSPTVDTSSIANALAIAQRLVQTLTAAGSAASKLSSNAEAQMRRAHSDYGVTP